MTNLTRKEFLLQELCKSKEDILEALSSSKIKSNVRLNELCQLISELTNELQEKNIERNQMVNTEKKLLLFPEWDYEEAKLIVTDIVNSVELLGDIWLNESLKCVTVRIFTFDSIPKVPGKYSILFIDTITKSIEKYTEKINAQSPKSLEYRLNKNYTKMVLEHSSNYCNSRLKEIYEDYIKSLNFAKTKPILIETLLENLLTEAK